MSTPASRPRTYLITGMSGAGKSSVVRELIALGFDAIDLDSAQWSHWVDAAADDALTPEQGRDWVWREDRVAALLAEPARTPRLLAGTASNMAAFYDRFDAVVLLSASEDCLLQRLRERGAGEYGSTQAQRAAVRELIAQVEPLLRESADLTLDSSGPVAATVRDLLRALDLTAALPTPGR
ncbi:AAA family ATPase [Lysobacter yananisis]|uniref:AAA family ATPase n=1 Tax=Lysobacter yananisis TaxID=1003114 RepID=A0ABY9P6T6_9GAMM|nr:AAA family ATPase [Lysobacter yananisis]WMT02732.1 AAA family ATPase [Lysobacter yananisis]